ncbi:MAG TPA: hypothetical protein VKP30_23425, partial [Polyangiaceae bacterium]|nr:hypothetical protein [Polyangiaceae bacterium]
LRVRLLNQRPRRLLATDSAASNCKWRRRAVVPLVVSRILWGVPGFYSLRAAKNPSGATEE